MFRYKAPNPYKQPQSLLSSLFSFSSSSIEPGSVSSSASLGKLILPAQQYGEAREDKLESKEVDISRGEIITYDDATLRTIMITRKAEAKTDDKNKKYVIKFNGNGGLYQVRINEFANESQKLGVTVVGFNYRNVAGSTVEPSEFKNLVTDGIAQVQNLLDKGVSSENILLDGHSLGGAVATKTAEYFHQLKKPIYLVNDRSFATLPKAAAGIVSSESIESVGAFSLSSIMTPLGWGGDAASAYQSIPASYKQYLVVVPEKGKSVGDGVISHSASLHNTVSSQEQSAKKITGHVFYSGARAGHNLPRASLFSKDNAKKSAQDTYEEFVKKAFK